MFGGVEGNETSKDLWTYSTTANTWSVQRYTSTVPMGVAGHTAHIIRGVMYVLFGYSPIYGYQNRIQEYNIGKLYRLMNLQAIIVDKFESNSKGRLLVKKKKKGIQRKTLKLNVEIRCIVFSRFICKLSLLI